MGKHRVTETRKLFILAFIALLAVGMTACSSGKIDEGSASSTASSPLAPPSGQQEEESGELFELKADSFEQTPEGTKPDPLAEDSPIYVAEGSREAGIRLTLSLDKRGDFLLATGNGELNNGNGASVPFTIDQTSVMHSDSLSEGKTLVYGGLTVNAKESNLVFVLGFRYVPETKELELRLANGEGLVVFGHGETLDSSKTRIEELESGHRPRNAE
jgi:hypothetical protein